MGEWLGGWEWRLNLKLGVSGLSSLSPRRLRLSFFQRTLSRLHSALICRGMSASGNISLVTKLKAQPQRVLQRRALLFLNSLHFAALNFCFEKIGAHFGKL